MDAGSARRIDPEALLANAAWIRALALRLVQDEAGADDVAQDTLTAAWEKPPRAHVPLAPWLARVARNFAFRALRSRRRRALREAARVLPTAPPSVEESAIRTEMFHQVVGAVLRLEPMYRDVVVLRFFEGLEMPAAAERLGVPLETARTRLKRALAFLRAHLDRTHGNRQSWALALVPLADATSSLTTSATTGGLLMAASGKVVAGIGLAGAFAGAALTLGATALLDVGPTPQRASPSDSALELRAADSTGSTTATGTAPRLEGAQARLGAASPKSGMTLQDLIDSVEVVLPPPGTGTITGRVTAKKDGRPVEGVTVRAWAHQPGGFSYRRGVVPVQPLLEESVRQAIVHSKWAAATNRETRTDANGDFVLKDLPDISYSVGAYSEGREVRLGPGRGSDVMPGGVVSFVAQDLVTLPLTVLMPDGKPVESARISWTVPLRGGGGAVMWNARDPVVQLEPGDWSITAEIGEDLRSAPIAITATVKNEPIVLTLLGRNILKGNVQLDPSDAAWKSVFLSYRRRESDAWVRPTQVSVRAPDWSFHISDLASGEYEVSAGLSESAPLVTTTVRVSGRTVVPTLVFPRLTSAHVLEVRVLGPGGAAPGEGDVSFGIQERNATTNMAYGARSTRRADGTYLVALMTPSIAERERARADRAGGVSVPAGGGGAAAGESPPDQGSSTLFIQVTYKGQGHKEVEYVPGSTSRVEVTFE